MGAGVHHRVLLVVVGQVGVGGVRVEGELEDLHPRQAEAVAQGLHFGGDDAQVLGHQGQVLAEVGLEGLEEGRTRAGHPTARSGGGGIGGNLPVRLETAEVIDAHQIEQDQLASQAVQPPAVTSLGQGGPVVERIAPALAGGGEVVGGYAGDGGGAAGLVQKEQFPVRPDVGAVVGDEDGQVTEQAHVTPVGLVTQGQPLALEQVLLEADTVQGFHRLCVEGGEDLGVAVTVRKGPLVPRTPEALAQDEETGEIVQPVGLIAAEGLVVRVGLAAGAAKACVREGRPVRA